MFSFLISFFSSALLTLLVIKQSRLHGPALDADFGGVQKVHAHPVARIGGLPIFMAVLLSAAVSIWRVPQMTTTMLSLLMCASVAFAGGIIEDYTGKVSPSRRLLLTMAAALMAWYLIDAKLDRIDMPFGVLSLHYAWLFLPLLAWRQLSRMRTEAAAAGESDLKLTPRWMNSLLAGMGKLDAGLCRELRVPFGSSVFAVARKAKRSTGGRPHGIN